MAISSWGQYDTAGLTKESQGQGYSGSNNGYVIYTNGGDGVSYDQVNALYKQLIDKNQPYVDPNSLAVMAIAMGLKPNFGDPQYIQDAVTTGKSSTGKPRGMDDSGKAFIANKLGITVDQINKNNQAFVSGDMSKAVSPQGVLSSLPQADAAKLKALQDYGATQITPPKPSLQVSQNASPAVQKELQISQKPDGTFDFQGTNYKSIEYAQAAQTRFLKKNPQYAEQVPQQTQQLVDSGQVMQGDGGQIQINTGNPEIDQMANSYLDSIWGRYQNLLQGLPGEIDDNVMKGLEAEVEKQFGPELNRMKAQAETIYNEELTRSRDSQNIQNQGLNNQLLRGQEDVNSQSRRIQEDVGRQTKLLGRSFQEAMNEIATSFRAKNRTFSGQRVKSEQDAALKNQESVDELNRQSERQISDLQRNQSRGAEDIGLQQRQLNLQQQGTESGLSRQLDEQNRSVNDARAQALLQRYQQVQELPFRLAPQFMENTGFGNVDSSVLSQQNPYITSSTINPRAQSLVAATAPSYASDITQGPNGYSYGGKNYTTMEFAEAAKRRS